MFSLQAYSKYCLIQDQSLDSQPFPNLLIIKLMCKHWVQNCFFMKMKEYKHKVLYFEWL